MIKKWDRQMAILLCILLLTLHMVGRGTVPIKSIASGPGAYIGTANLIGADTTTPTGYSGKDVQVRLTIKNIGDGAATNVSIRPVIKVGTDSPFEPRNMGISTIRYINAGGTGSAVFTIGVKEKAVTGYYSVDFEVIYYEETEDDVAATSHTKTLTSYVFIEGLDESETGTETDINISLRNSPTPASSSFNCPLKFDLYLNNFGRSDAYSVSITPTLSASTKDYPFEIEKATYEIALKSPLLGTKSQPDEAARNQVVHYSMNVRNDVTTGYYPVVFKIVAKDENGKYIRIIDYKSSAKNIDLNEVYAGLQIQLLTYTDAICKQSDIIPAGIFYFSLLEQMVKADKKMTEEEIEELIRKNFKMKGLIIADVKIIKMNDNTLKTGSSKLVPAALTASGEINKKWTNGVTQEEFKELQDYIYKTIKDIGKEILSGKIDLKPYNKKGNTPCTYCKYHAICGFNSKQNDNCYNYIDQKTKDEILMKMSTGDVS